MLKKAYRLKSRWDFKKALASQRICANDCLAVYGLLPSPNRPVAPTRFGLIVSKKIHKRAVRRNLIKRRMREIIRTELLVNHREQVARFSAVVIIARSGSLEADYATLSRKLIGCFIAASKPGNSKKIVNNR
jgi:ribonuclease P protein component